MIERSITELGAALRRGEVTAAALAEKAIGRHRRLEPTLNAYRSFDEGLIRRQAAAADALFAAGCDLGPFQGLPVSVKDLFGLNGFPTYAGTPRPLPPEFEREGPVVGALRRQGALLGGKTHTVEFAFGGLGTNRHYGAPRNPWDAERHRVSGGSSSGAGVSLCQGTAVLAFGSDTTGSVRMPASWTGTVGLRVGLGRWSGEGLMPLSETLDTPGVLARSVADIALAFAVIDLETTELPEAFVAGLGRTGLDGLRLGVPERFFFDGCSPGVAEGVRAALDEMVAAGARLVPFELPEAEAAFDLWKHGHLSAPEAYTTLRTTALSAWVDTLDPNVWTRMSTYGEMSAAEYIGRRRRVLGWMEAVNRRVAAEVDAFVAPTISITAPTLDEVATLDGYRERNVAASRNAAVLSLFDLCAVTLPVALDGAGIPVGMQVATARGREARLLGMALAMERRLGTARERLGRPPLVPAG